MKNSPDAAIALQRDFYHRPTAEVARDLVGHELVRHIFADGKRWALSGTIIETEAYGFEDDEASHAFRGATRRNAAMFGPLGFSYVYFTYGNHYCLNVAARDDSTGAGAVLIRSVKPTSGIGLMRTLRSRQDVRELASGPGKLTQAMGISLSQNGIDLTSRLSEIFIRRNKPNPILRVQSCRRIGISKACDKPWRFIDISNPLYLSRKPRPDQTVS